MIALEACGQEIGQIQIATFANPAGHTAVLRADERREMLVEAERRLHRFGLDAEAVPADYGGRLQRADRLAGLHRTVWRRDVCLGVGSGLGSLAAWSTVWASGTDQQRREAHHAGPVLAVEVRERARGRGRVGRRPRSRVERAQPAERLLDGVATPAAVHAHDGSGAEY